MRRTEQEILEEAFDGFEPAVDYAERARRANRLDQQWNEMRAMRNRIVHGYEFVDADIVLRTAADDVPRVLAIIEAVIGPQARH